jgi:phosphoribosylglycinamide formyltransferase-1
MGKKIRIGGLISGTGTNMDAIIKACEEEKIDGDVIFIGSDNPDAKGLEKAAKKKIPSFVVNYAKIIKNFKHAPEDHFFPDDFDFEDIKFKQSLLNKETDAKKVSTFIETRAIAEAALLDRMKDYPFDLLVLAGFMRNLTPYFIDRVNTTPGNPRIMNIHPALLPAFPGVDGYGDTFRYGCKIGGCTVHFIDYGEDSGPIIGQKSFFIDAEDTIDSIKQKGLALEYQLYPECIQLFAQNRLACVKMTYTDDKGNISQRTVVKISIEK